MTDLTNPVAIEIARLLAHGEDKHKVIFTLATKFPDVRLAAFDATLRDVIALQRLVAAELAEREWKSSRIARQSDRPKWGCRYPTFH